MFLGLGLGVCRRPRVAVVLVVFLSIVIGGIGGIAWIAPAATAAAVGYRPPIDPADGVITDHFRAPDGPYGAGNRGIDYRTVPLSPVHATAAGVVIFAGSVAGASHLTIRHADGLRSTYSFVASIAVAVGASVDQGDVIATTADVFHFGVRDPDDTYLDPERLFVGEGSWHVHLRPGGDDGSRASGTEEVPPLAPDRFAGLRLWMRSAAESRPEIHAARITAGLADWYAHRHDCTPAAEPVPTRAGRRIVIEVAGIGSTSTGAAIDELDTDALGYARGDVIRFSYRGGRVPSTRVDPAFGSVPVNAYGPRDSQQDLRAAGARLAELVAQVAAAAPGVPIDLVGHSQGGIVARLALTDTSRPLPSEVQHLVTLATPHQGADVAAIVAAGRTSPDGAAIEDVWQRVLGLDLDGGSPAAGELVGSSDLIDALGATPLPGQVHVTSIGARGDVVVTANRTAVFGANVRNTVVPVVGIDAHDRLPGSAAATREIARALAGRPPTCRGLAQVTADLVESESLSAVESAAALEVQQGAAALRWPVPGGSP